MSAKLVGVALQIITCMIKNTTALDAVEHFRPQRGYSVFHSSSCRSAVVVQSQPASLPRSEKHIKGLNLPSPIVLTGPLVFSAEMAGVLRLVCESLVINLRSFYWYKLIMKQLFACY